MQVLRSKIDAHAGALMAPPCGMLERLAALEEQQAVAVGAAGPRYASAPRSGQAHGRRARRVLLDRDTPFLELSTVAAWGTDYHVAPASSPVSGIAGVECVVTAHDPTVAVASRPVDMEESASRAGDLSENRLPLVNIANPEAAS